MKRIGLIALLVLAVGSVALTGFGASRGSIAILGNGDFTEQNGVISGRGTQDDPYIIAGWEISVASGEYYGVRVENVTASFVLRGLVINGAVDYEGAAIRIGFAANGVIEDCAIASSANGIEISSSTDITVESNVLYVQGFGLRVTGESAAEYRHQIGQSNLFNNSPIFYYYGLDGERIEGIETRHLTIAGSRDVTVIRNTVVDGDGIQLAFVTDSTVTANITGRNSNVPTEHAMHLYECQRNTISTNLIKNSRLAGIQLTLSSENEIVENYLGVNDTGIRLVGSRKNRLAQNELLGCYTAIWLAGASEDNRIEDNVIIGKVSADGDRRQGIVLDLASGNRIERNALTECEIGITLEAKASRNVIAENSIIAGGYGIFVTGSYNDIEGNLLSQQTRGVLFPETYGQSITRGNVFSENVFGDNVHHLYTNLDCEANEFGGNVFLGDARILVTDRGTGNQWSISGIGNFWGDADVEDADGDGIGDTAVVVYPAARQDEAPLASIDPAELRVGILGTLRRGTVSIERGDGSNVEVASLFAESAAQRWVGFRGFPETLLDGFPGILFSFGEEAELRFTMVTVPFDLDIAFFDSDGELVGSTTMTAMAEDLYTATAPFQYALELPSGMLAELSLEEGARLMLPATD